MLYLDYTLHMSSDTWQPVAPAVARAGKISAHDVLVPGVCQSHKPQPFTL